MGLGPISAFPLEPVYWAAGRATCRVLKLAEPRLPQLLMQLAPLSPLHVMKLPDRLDLLQQAANQGTQ